MLNPFKQAPNSTILAISQVLRKIYENILEWLQVMIAESIINWLGFFCYYFRNDLTEMTWGLLFSSFHECVAFLMS